MGTFNHVLCGNKTGQFPRNWCFVDTETREIRIDDKTKKQVLRLGTAIYTRDKATGRPAIRKVWSFRTAKGFWDNVIQESENDRRLVILAYNVGFDCRILDMFRCLPSLGFELLNFFDKGKVFIASWRNGKHKITILDAMNYFTGKLESWGEMLGVPKGKIDFETVSYKKLLEYCHQDTLILSRIWEKWREFVTINDLGCFSPTKASQAMSAFRHRFMKTPIFIHANPKARQVERESYFGGRSECFRLGKIKGGPFFKLDVNSMYAYIMERTAVPVRLRQMRAGCSIARVRKALRQYGVVARVTIETDIPAYPFRRDGYLIYPIGRFNVTLAGPELTFAIRRGHIKKIHFATAYDVAIIFRSYIRELYALRCRYKAENDKVFEQLVKYLLCILHGKFAQRNEIWKRLDHKVKSGDGSFFYPGSSLTNGDKFRVIAGQVFKLTGIRDSMHSFHAISSYITSASRMYLWSLIELAGRKHVFYVDTDSLIVDSVGHKNLREKIDATKLGMLKLEYVTKLLRIHAPKDYQTGCEIHIKGVSAQYKRVGKNHYTGWQWEGMRGAIQSGHTDCVVMHRRDKVLYRDCKKGVLHSSGSISPFVLDGESSLSLASIRLS